MDADQIIDAFVAKVNTGRREPESFEDVPPALRRPFLDEFGVEDDLFTDWHIARSDHTSRIIDLEQRMGLSFPSSFRTFICRYSFPAFESRPLMLFANTGLTLFWELQDRLFSDPVMSPFLLKAHFIQIGNPQFYDYDPVCLEARATAVEGAVVQINHEAILCNQELVIRRTIAPSFVQLIQALVEDEA